MAKSGYYVFLKKCLLPVTPKKLKTKINSANKTVTLINDGEINILKTAELTDIEFECEIPQVQYPYVILTGAAVNAHTAVCLIALVFLSWLCAMVGYDKVVQAISQFKTE